MKEWYFKAAALALGFTLIVLGLQQAGFVLNGLMLAGVVLVTAGAIGWPPVANQVEGGKAFVVSAKGRGSIGRQTQP
ncbi:hypothetical protein [Ferrimonas kyonanensis]|uniref:hypothetical protein n=1 Tax=Ferrimonas kyonanensis TaxID=364763 RepID=UPI0003F7E9E5|nr:hypothetical protein [Ferrimonas kyonanensis]